MQAHVQVQLPPLSPAQRYQQDLDRGIIIPDQAQSAAIAALDVIYHELLKKWQQPQSRWRKIASRFGFAQAKKPEKGLYLWGGVGRGKTCLMDLFFHALPGTRKLRMHFHRFMLMVHQRLHDEKGHSDPLARVAEKLAVSTDVLCLDEFFVSDIGDAMILGNLLETLFAEGVLLVTTSNLPPERLYENGLQRRRFLPAIALLEKRTHVLNVDGGIDYRLKSLDKAAVYHFPLGPESRQALAALFADLSRGAHAQQHKELDIQGRNLRARCWSEGLVWFDFDMLCGGPRGAADYLELARQYHTVFVSDIPVLHENLDDKARRFITLVDAFYDHRVKLVISAADGPGNLYRGVALRFPFQRVASRLQEMQTHEYLAAAHNPD